MWPVGMGVASAKLHPKNGDRQSARPPSHRPARSFNCRISPNGLQLPLLQTLAPEEKAHPPGCQLPFLGSWKNKRHRASPRVGTMFFRLSQRRSAESTESKKRSRIANFLAALSAPLHYIRGRPANVFASKDRHRDVIAPAQGWRSSAKVRKTVDYGSS